MLGNDNYKIIYEWVERMERELPYEGTFSLRWPINIGDGPMSTSSIYIIRTGIENTLCDLYDVEIFHTHYATREERITIHIKAKES